MSVALLPSFLLRLSIVMKCVESDNECYGPIIMRMIISFLVRNYVALLFMLAFIGA